MAGTVQRSRLQISKTTPAQRLGLLRYPLLGAKRTSLKCPRMSASAQSGHTLNQIKRWSAFFDLNQIQRPYTANSVSGILCGEGARRIIMRDNSKLLLGFFVTISFISFVFAFLGQSTRPMLADGGIAPQPVSYTPADATSSQSGSMARTKKMRMACYPVGGDCTKHSECCTGFCRTGLSNTFCDNP
jgi:hypothetical protein